MRIAATTFGVKPTAAWMCRTSAARRILLTGVFAVGALPMAQNATAAEERAIEEVLVTGIRASLQDALGMRRGAETILEVISAEDIGKFPDENLAESLQRVTGVQIDRNRGEGRSVTVRGLRPDFTRIQFNGRTLASATGSRSFDFTSLSSDFVSALEVSKTPTADMEEGGISATVNVRTIRPFDIGERRLSGSLFGVGEDKAGEIDSKFTVLYSDLFADETVGLALGYSQGTRSVNTHQYEAFGVEPANEGSPIAGPRIPLDFNQDGDTDDALSGTGFNHAGNYGVNQGPRERSNTFVALQLRPNEDVELWFDGLHTSFESNLTRAQNSHRYTNVNPQRAGDPAGLVNAVITGGLVTTLDIDAVDHRNNNRREDIEDDTLSLALGANWALSDSLSAEVEISNSSSERTISNLSLEIIGRASMVQQIGDPSGIPSIRYMRGYDPLDPNNFRALNLNGQLGSTEEDDNFDIRLDFDYELGGDVFTSVEFGVKQTDRERQRNRLDLFVGGEDLARLLGVPFEADVESGSFAAAPFMTTFEESDFIGNADSAGAYPNRFIVSSSDLVLGRASLAQITGEFPLVPNLANNYGVAEEVQAAYVKGNFEGMEGRLSGNVGVRYVRTEQESTGYGADLNDLSYALGGSVTTANSVTAVSASSTYSEFLPSLNLRYDFNEELVGRLGVARTITRPTLSQLSPASSSINLNVGTIDQGNPGLEPFFANQVDLSLSWYFGESGLLSAAYFHRDLDNLVVNGELENISLTATLVETGEPRVFPSVKVRAPVNGDSLTLSGFELSYQQPFTFLPGFFSDFGVIANYTALDPSVDFLDSVSETSYNLTGYYENDRVSARLAYNYRDEFQNSGVNYFGDGAVVQEYGQLDLSVNVRATDNIDLVFEALNLNEEPLTTLNDAGVNRGVEDAGLRYTFGVRANF